MPKRPLENTDPKTTLKKTKITSVESCLYVVEREEEKGYYTGASQSVSENSESLLPILPTNTQTSSDNQALNAPNDITTLEFDMSDISNPDIIEFINGPNDITTLKFDMRHISNTEMLYVIEKSKLCTNLTTVFLREIYIDDTIAILLAQALFAQQNLTELTIINSNISALGYKCLIRSIENKNMTTLFISGENSIDDKGERHNKNYEDIITSLSRLLIKNTLNTLCLDNFYLTDEHLRNLELALTQNDSLTSVQLSDCRFGCIGLLSIIRGLHNNMLSDGLKLLDLSRNDIGDLGVIALAHALKNIPSSKPFSICVNDDDGEVSDIGAIALTQASKYNKLVQIKYNLPEDSNSIIGMEEYSHKRHLDEFAIRLTGTPEMEFFLEDVQFLHACDYEFLSKNVAIKIAKQDPNFANLSISDRELELYLSGDEYNDRVSTALQEYTTKAVNSIDQYLKNQNYADTAIHPLVLFKICKDVSQLQSVFGINEVVLKIFSYLSPVDIKTNASHFPAKIGYDELIEIGVNCSLQKVPNLIQKYNKVADFAEAVLTDKDYDIHSIPVDILGNFQEQYFGQFYGEITPELLHLF